MLINDYMNKNFQSYSTKDTLKTAIKAFLQTNAKIIPIVNQEGKLIGIISKNKVFELLANEVPLDTLIESFYRKDPIYLKNNLTLNDAKTHLLNHNVGHAPVVNNTDELIGIISTEELLDSYSSIYDQLTSVLNFTYDAIIVVDKNANITMVNDSFFDLFPIINKSIISKSVSDLLPELDIENLMKRGIDITNSAQIINDQHALVSINLIKENEQLNSAICKISFRGLTNLQEALTKVKKLEHQVMTYKDEIHKSKGTKYTLHDIAGKSDAITKVKTAARAAAQSMSTVLITGETGTGKELFAQGIHAASNQTGKFVEINCAAVPADLLESEFFGYESGAFTGAKPGGMKGKFELAQNGTIFLDEIGDMPLPLQVKLLRVLQEKEFSPIGSTQTIHLDTKIIAATNKNLVTQIQKGLFREDLYYRLNIVDLKIPPLRTRIGDIPDIVDVIISNLNQSGFFIKGITHAALVNLMNYSWPGNVRELHNAIERAANIQRSDYIDVGDISFMENNRLEKINEIEDTSAYNIHKRINITEKDSIIAALKEAKGNKTKASKLLGISRPWLYKKMTEHGLF